MNHLFSLIVFLGFLILPTFAKTQTLETYLNNLPNEIEVSIKAERYNGEILFEQNANKKVPSASIIKVPILIELLKKVGNGDLKWNELYVLRAADIVGGAGNLQEQKPGFQISIKELAEKMIILSDNTATNILIRKVGMEKVNDFIRTQQLKQTTLQREMMDFDAIKEGRQNYTSAADMNQLYTSLLDQQLLSKKGTKRTLKLLAKCEDTSTIPRLLPKRLKIAHKTGTLDYLRGDAGIIYTKGTPIILSVFVEKFDSLAQAEEIIGEVSKYILELDK
ncbi:MAG: serine hydrolase [Bacteroidota bacterium]